VAVDGWAVVSVTIIFYLPQYTQKTVTQVTPEAPAHPCLLRHYSQ
jgi:hypothetical protein